MSKSVNLGRKLGDMISISPIDKDEAHYPALVLSDVTDKQISEMPDDGECTIRYHVCSRTHHEEDGKPYSCTLRLDVKSITPPAAKRKQKEYDGGARKAASDYFKDK
jgi:hypothetical protein